MPISGLLASCLWGRRRRRSGPREYNDTCSCASGRTSQLGRSFPPQRRGQERHDRDRPRRSLHPGAWPRLGSSGSGRRQGSWGCVVGGSLAQGAYQVEVRSAKSRDVGLPSAAPCARNPHGRSGCRSASAEPAICLAVAVVCAAGATTFDISTHFTIVHTCIIILYPPWVDSRDPPRRLPPRSGALCSATQVRATGTTRRP